MIIKIMRNNSEFSRCSNNCNNFFRLMLINHEITYDMLLWKSTYAPLPYIWNRGGGNAPVMLPLFCVPVLQPSQKLKRILIQPTEATPVQVTFGTIYFDCTRIGFRAISSILLLTDVANERKLKSRSAKQHPNADRNFAQKKSKHHSRATNVKIDRSLPRRLFLNSWRQSYALWNKMMNPSNHSTVAKCWSREIWIQVFLTSYFLKKHDAVPSSQITYNFLWTCFVKKDDNLVWKASTDMDVLFCVLEVTVASTRSYLSLWLGQNFKSVMTSRMSSSSIFFRRNWTCENV